MPTYIRYFWFILAAFMVINIVIWSRRLTMVVERGLATTEERDQFIRWSAVGLIGLPILLGIVGLVAGWTSPMCGGILQFNDAPSAVVSVITLAGWVGLLWWVWRGNGADFLSRVAPALGKRPVYDKPYSPSMVRLAVTALVLVAGVASTVSSRVMPMQRELVCPVVATGYHHDA